MSSQNTKSDNEMSMEEILSSIRRYVSEDKEISSDEEYNNEDRHGLSEPVSGISDVISLNESQIKQGSEEENEMTNEQKTADVQTYSERSTLSTSVASVGAEETKRKTSPFEQLTNALNAYGKNKKANTVGAKTVEQLFSEIATKIIQNWVDSKMESFVEKIVMREIEKIKSE